MAAEGQHAAAPRALLRPAPRNHARRQSAAAQGERALQENPSETNADTITYTLAIAALNLRQIVVGSECLRTPQYWMPLLDRIRLIGILFHVGTILIVS